MIEPYTREMCMLLLKITNNVQFGKIRSMFSKHFYVSVRDRGAIILKCKEDIRNDDIKIRVVIRDHKIVSYRLRYKCQDYPLYTPRSLQLNIIKTCDIRISHEKKHTTKNVYNLLYNVLYIPDELCNIILEYIYHSISV